MKKLYLIGGTMGVGKTAVSERLKKNLPFAVFLDGDWCWDASPFTVTEETKAMVLDNIRHTLDNFIHCSAYENIVFCWVMHEQGIIDSILGGIDAAGCEIKVISLLANEKTISERISGDIEKGIRPPDVFERSLARLPLYPPLESIKIDTNGKTVEMIAKEIEEL